MRKITNPDGIVRTAQLNHFRDKTDARYATSMWTLNSAPTAMTLSITDGSSTYYFKPGDEVRVRNTADGAAEANYYIIYKLHDITTTDGVKKAWWAEAGTGGSGATLNRVKVDVAGVSTDTPITLTNVTDGTTETKTWTGTTLTFDGLDTSKTYKVSAPQKAGYALATAEYTLTAFEIFSGVTKTFTYEECKVVLTVGMSDASATDLARVQPKISINGGTAQVMTGSNGTFEAALNEGDAYEITFTDLTQYGYQAPATISGTKDTGGITRLTGYEYQTTIYTLTSIRTTKDGNVQGSNPSGVGCKLSYTGLQTPVSLTAAGQTAKVPTNLVSSVVITPSTVYGYAASDEGSGQTIQLLYATTAYTLTVSTNQSDAATVLENTVIRVGDEHSGLSQAGYLDFTGARTATEILVPAGTAITAALVSAQSGKPAAASYAESITVVGQVITVTCSQERLSIGLTADEGTPDLTGVTITVKNMTDAQNPVVLTTATGSLTAFGIAFGTPYTVELSGVEGYSTPQFNGGSARTAAAASYSEAMQYAKITVVSDYIILDQTSSDPTTKVKDSAGRTYSSGYTRPSVIDQIRAASHCYVGTLADGVMSLKQLDDTDGTKYADGTSAATDITGSTGKDVFMRLPIFFTRATEIETDKWRIEFAFDPSQVDANGQIISTTSAQPAGTGWVQWGGNDLIGKYKGYDTSSKLYSISGKASTASISQANFKAHATARGTGYSLVKWHHQNIMAILFYAYYGHTNCQELLGTGANSRNRTTGQKNSLGMTDTTSSNGNADNIVFWGLENWWGDLYEWVDNVVVNSGTWSITEGDGTTRTIPVASTMGATGSWIYPSKFIIGDDLDTIGAPGQSGGSATQGYCDGQYIANSASRVVARSCHNAETHGGVACVDANDDSASTYTIVGSRLAFNGTIEIS